VLVLLVCEPDEIRSRVTRRPGDISPSDYFKNLQLSLQQIYEDPKLVRLDTTNLTIRQMVKEIARIVHLGTNHELDVHQRLAQIAGRPK
jgi:hypothetical protein